MENESEVTGYKVNKNTEAVGGASFGCECYYLCILATTTLMQSHDPNKHFLVTYFSAANRRSTF